MTVLGVFYAIPPGSSFYRCLESQPSIIEIAEYLFDRGRGIYSFFDIEPDQVDIEIKELIEVFCGREYFPTELSVEKAIAEYRSEIMLTRQNYPGVENRELILSGTSIEIQKRLKPELLRRQIENAEEFLTKIFYGDQMTGAFGAMSRQLVSQGASILPQIDAEALFPLDSVLLEDFEALRNLYLAVDANNEEILVSYE
jgi:hypothetical protein